MKYSKNYDFVIIRVQNHRVQKNLDENDHALFVLRSVRMILDLFSCKKIRKKKHKNSLIRVYFLLLLKSAHGPPKVGRGPLFFKNKEVYFR